MSDFLLDNRLTPALPGDFKDMKSLQAFTMKQKQALGFTAQTTVGLNKFQNITFPGSARLLLGFTTFDTSLNPGNIMTLNINGEDIVTDASWAEFTKVLQFGSNAGEVVGSSYKDEYYPYFRGLSGNDQVKILYNVLTGNKLFSITFYYKTEFDLKQIK